MSSGVASRTRSKRKNTAVDLPDVLFLGEDIYEGERGNDLVSRQGTRGNGAEKMESASGASSSKFKGPQVAEPDVVCLGEFSDERECWPVSYDKHVPPPIEVIEISESDDAADDDDDDGVEGMNHDSEDKSEHDNDDDEETEDKSIEGEGSEKAESFGHHVRGLAAESPILIHADSVSEEGSKGVESGWEDDESGSSTDSSDDDDESDEDFLADDVAEGPGSSEDGSSTSYDDDEEDEDGRKERWRRCNKQRRKVLRESSMEEQGREVVRESTSMEERGRKVETESSAICRKNGESSTSLESKKYKEVEEQEEQKELESTRSTSSKSEKDKEEAKKKEVEEKEHIPSCSSAHCDKCGGQHLEDLWKEAESGWTSVASGERQNEDCSRKLYEERGKNVVRKSGLKRIERTGENAGVDVKVTGYCQKRLCRSKPLEDEAKNDKKIQEDSWRNKKHIEKNDAITDDNGCVKKEVGETKMVMKNEKERGKKNKQSEKKDANTDYYDCVKTRVDNKSGNDYKVSRYPSRPKEMRLIELLAECLLVKPDPIKDTSNRTEERDDDVQWRDTRPPACVENPLWTFGAKKDVPVEETESEKEFEKLWEEMETVLRSEEVDSLVGNAWTTEAGQNGGSPVCKHDLFLDEETGIMCRWCGWVAIEIKGVTPPFVDECPRQGSRKRVQSDEANFSLFDGAQFDVCDGGSDAAACSHNEGTVWDLIPDIKQNLYAHQQEGFEFLWTNLAGSMDLAALKSADPSGAGGCIISHAPGTGKTRLTIVFLQTFLEVFPKCHPVIVAPASILLTWEDEFRKWVTGVTFHNLNSDELSGKEDAAALKKFPWSQSNRKQITEAMRMVKLYSWFKEKSILGISYHLYEKFAGDSSKAKLRTTKKRRNRNREKREATVEENASREMMAKFLREIPGLLVLDEGHIPRNQHSKIFQVLSEAQTEKMIILSGTPFQNNFQELYNTICLVKPSFPERIPQELKKFCQSIPIQEKKASKGLSWEPVCKTSGNHAGDEIRQLKSLMDPFVHVHKGSILQKSLPGLKDCVVTLMPDDVQKVLLETLECSQNIWTFESEHKFSLVSVHPSLFLHCAPSEKEKPGVDGDQLEDLRLNPYAGVKTRFLVEFVRLCEAVNEKVLVFSQYIDPLRLVIDQLNAVFNWSEGKEVLYMSGGLDKKQRQSLIQGFNGADSQAKILLASTRACCEGISLVGASRVVLLDVVWNPSVERQAISRAYRIGQKKVVYTYHLITHGTTEYTKYCKQAKKDRLSELVFSARNGEDDRPKRPATVFEDQILDKMVRHDKLKDLFGEIVVQPKERDLLEDYGS